MTEQARFRSTERFGDRVDDYLRARPDYPPGVLRWLREAWGLRSGQSAADVGSGTGIWTRHLTDAGLEVTAIEPNDAMRRIAERLLAGSPRFRSVCGTAAATTLEPTSVDWITVAQAFHWFDPAESRREFTRILKPGGRVALIWNNRRHDTPFGAAYETFVRDFATDYADVRHERVEADGTLDRFFGVRPARAAFENHQRLDWEGLLRRCRSSSYMPGENHDRYAAMVGSLLTLFKRHEQAGRVSFDYETRVYVGSLV